VQAIPMTRRTPFAIALALAVGLLVVLLAWRTTRKSEFITDSSLLPFSPSPIHSTELSFAAPTATPLSSPLAWTETAVAPITAATLEAIRATRPTATPPRSPSGIRLPSISPATWRGWALRILAAAGVLAYIGLRLRRHQ